MIIEYKIDENDFLMYQLFFASKSARIKRKRQRSRIIVPVLYASFGLYGLYQEKYSIFFFFCAIALLWYFLYPLWDKRRHVRHYKGFIKENYKERFDRTASLELNNDFILAKDSGSESKVSTSEIEEINEIPSSIFIRLKVGQAFILPKNKIENIEVLLIN